MDTLIKTINPMAKKSSVLIDVLIDTDIDSNKEDNIPSFWILLEVFMYPNIGDEISFLSTDIKDNWSSLRDYDDVLITEEQYDYMDEELFIIVRKIFEPDGSISYWASRRL